MTTQRKQNLKELSPLIQNIASEDSVMEIENNFELDEFDKEKKSLFIKNETILRISNIFGLYKYLLGNLLILVSFCIIILLYYHYREDWSYVDCFYFLTVTVSTVGYGDITPTAPNTRLFTVIVIISISFVFNPTFVLSSKYLLSKLPYASDDSEPTARKNEIQFRLLVLGYLMIFLLLAGTIILNVLFERFYFMGAFYWCIVTISTIGYGDMELEESEEKLFAIFFIIVGMSLLVAMASLFEDMQVFSID